MAGCLHEYWEHLMHLCSCIIIWPLPVDNLGSGVVVARATISGIKQRAGTGVVPGVLSSGWWIWVGKCGCTCASVGRGRVYLYLS